MLRPAGIEKHAHFDCYFPSAFILYWSPTLHQQR
ncbi:MAG: hypothetical protein ACI83W_001079, partial [Marinoscillum sp.]